MKITTLYDQGTAKISEDGFFVRLPFAGVADGVSEVHHPNKKTIDFYGRTNGQTAVDCLINAFSGHDLEQNLRKNVLSANAEIWKFNNWLKIPMERPDCMPGASFVVVKISGNQVEIIQTGDCLVLWITKDGKIGITRNQCFSSDMELRQKFAELMKKHQGNRTEVWNEFIPILIQSKRDNVNMKYGLLNGQPNLKNCWQHISLSGIRFLMLFTDGLVYYPETGDEQVLARSILMLYEQEGLAGILKATRKKERIERHISHIDHGEATAVAIELD